VIVRATARATRDIERTAAWWRDTREVGAEGFLTEFQTFAELVAANPEIGQRYGYRGDRLIRRWLLPRAQVHVYYTVDLAAAVITVHAVWGARRGRGPRW
jgi:plasmid stabilization system protein ParE